MGKRKRTEIVESTIDGDGKATKLSNLPSEKQHEPIKVQIITGSYERVLHGIIATILPSPTDTLAYSAQFVDSFLLNAHGSAIRCLALSPLPESSFIDSPKITLATGGTDERINLYSLSASPTVENDKALPIPTLGGNKVLENPKNREIGSLLHHSSSITALHFPTRSKLLSAAEDNTIAVTRSRDWAVISTIKAPRPKVQGRPSGDTAPPGAAPAGVNDFAVHPSMKLMLSVGKGERCMRLWNLVTGKKAGVLNFEKGLLHDVKEGKHGSGEGRKIEWSPDGQEFSVAFERGVVVFGADSKPKAKILPSPLTKIHQLKYTAVTTADTAQSFLVVSTEDGRVIFYSTDPAAEESRSANQDSQISEPIARAQLGGRVAHLTVRIKDFEILQFATDQHGLGDCLIVTCSSDGTVRLWTVPMDDLNLSSRKVTNGASSAGTESHDAAPSVPQIGTLIGSYETANRITCLKAFVMLKTEDEDEETVSGSNESFEGFSEGSSSDGVEDEDENLNGETNGHP